MIKDLNMLKCRELIAWMDGGSVSLFCTNQLGEEIEILIVQHMIQDYYEKLNKIPGRLYFNGQIIEKRSKEEVSILEYFDRTVIKITDKLEREILKDKIAFIKSEDYIKFSPIKMILSDKRKKYLEEQRKK